VLSTPSMLLLPLDHVQSHWLLVETQFLLMFSSLLHILATLSVPLFTARNHNPPTHSCSVWVGAQKLILPATGLAFHRFSSSFACALFLSLASLSLYSSLQFISFDSITLNTLPCNGFVSTSAHISLVGQHQK
jgi:hypothetical protein